MAGGHSEDTVLEELVSTNTGQKVKPDLMALCPLVGNVFQKEAGRNCWVRIIDNSLPHEYL